jgi:hypothetical protein
MDPVSYVSPGSARPARLVRNIGRPPKPNQKECGRILMRTITYPGTTFESVIFSYEPVVNALYEVEPTFTAFPPHKNHFYPKYVKGRGVGLFAGRDFDVGETIILERPSFMKPLFLLPQHLELLPQAMDRLPSDQFMSACLLSSCKPDQTWLMGMFNTNSFGFALPIPHFTPEDVVPWWKLAGNLDPPPADIGWLQVMLFLTASRLNHSYVADLVRFPP